MTDIRVSLLPSAVKRAFVAALSPLASPLIRLGVRPNTITSIGTMFLLGSGAAFGIGAPRVGAAWLLLSGVLDILDGQVARGGGMSSKFGAFFDSTLDRIGEAALFSGIGIYFVTAAGQSLPVLGLGMALAGLSAAFLVSYTRARAEGLGLECQVGIAQRPERIVLLGGPTLFVGVGPGGVVLLALVTAVAILSLVTVIQRVAYVFNLSVPSPPAAVSDASRTERSARPAVQRSPAPAVAESFGKGS